MEKITRMAAIREFFHTPIKPLTLPEIKAFWMSLDEHGKTYYASECAKALGKELEPV